MTSHEGTDLRLSYVIWQEQVNPAVIVELLSPGTEQEDLGQTQRLSGQPPTKWQVYEQILQVPYYIVYDRHSRSLRAFHLQGGRYQEWQLSAPRVWLPNVNLGLGLWQGSFDDVLGFWLRWYDADENWVLTEIEQERQRTEQERQRADALAQRLRDLGLEP